MKKACLAATALAASALTGMIGSGTAIAAAPAACSLLKGPVRHIVYLQFDNTHFIRDVPSVPSDMEQMPTLYNFLVDNGVLGTANHTQLISHTADGILNSITGLYPDRVGSAISNSFGYYSTDGSVGFASDFVYWTDTVSAAGGDPGDNAPVLITDTGKNTPAPWVAFTRAGCDFGAVALADMELENNSSDIINVFGANSPEYQEARSNYDAGVADFEGISVHCAQNSTICAANASHARPDLLPDEPGGYAGYQALFGSKYVVPAITGGRQTSLTDLEGAPIAYTDVYKGTTTVTPGFPGFDGMFPKVTLSYVAQMLEAGIPVVYGYLSDAHDDHQPGDAHAYGPGESGFVAQLKDYDRGWQLFFKRLRNDGINPGNTLFVITVEEGDHFVGSSGAPSRCDGVTVPCTYAAIGEVNADQRRLVYTEHQNDTQFDSHYDMAPAVYVEGQPAAESAVVRQLETDLAATTAPDPLQGGRSIPLFQRMADQNEMKLLHMITADPLRTPSFTPFAQEDFYVTSYDPTATPPVCTGDFSDCVYESPGYAWNHGGFQNKIATTWLGMAGPGVLHRGMDTTTWTDHVDIRPTVLSLAHLSDDYQHDGRIIAEQLETSALPISIETNVAAFEQLAATYKQLTAPFGAVGVASLVYATQNVATPDSSTHNAYVSTIQSFTTQRDALAAAIRGYIDNAEFHGAVFDAHVAAEYTRQAKALIQQMHSLASGQ
jgi:hypothetical protein